MPNSPSPRRPNLRSAYYNAYGTSAANALAKVAAIQTAVRKLEKYEMQRRYPTPVGSKNYRYRVKQEKLRLRLRRAQNKAITEFNKNIKPLLTRAFLAHGRVAVNAAKAAAARRKN
jgi:hypothetical protein